MSSSVAFSKTSSTSSLVTPCSAQCCTFPAGSSSRRRPRQWQGLSGYGVTYMNAQDKAALIQRLVAISPMPDDEKLTEDVLKEHGRILKELPDVPDEDLIEPII